MRLPLANLAHWSLRKKFIAILAFALLVPTTLGLAMASYYWVSSSLEESQLTYKFVKGLQFAAHSQKAREAFFRNANMYLYQTVTNRGERSIEELDAELNTMDESITNLSAEIHATRDQTLIEEVNILEEDWRKQKVSLDDLLNQASSAKANELEEKIHQLVRETSTLSSELDTLQDKVQSVAFKNFKLAVLQEQISIVAMGVVAVMILIFIWKVSRFLLNSIGARLNDISGRLDSNALHLSSDAQTMSRSSQSLNRASTEQAAGLQETAAALDEISAMITRNAEGANNATRISQDSERAAQQGRVTVDGMITAINDIATSNHEIMKEIENNNQEISKIVSLITEINTKTQVINDIVFQTKLLSFNASVEAARAGDHGRGFAIVAEEIGNLAAVSGTAAKEIGQLLQTSVRNVNEIVETTKTNVNKLMVRALDKVEGGRITAAQCGAALDSILENVSKVNVTVQEIATASREQATGVQEVTSAMTRLDQITQENSTLAKDSASLSTELNERAGEIQSVVKSLIQLLKGKLERPPEVANGASRQKPTKGHIVSGKQSNVIPIGKRKDRKPKDQLPQTKPSLSVGEGKSSAKPSEVKLVAGEGLVPSADDPRFQDV